MVRGWQKQLLVSAGVAKAVIRMRVQQWLTGLMWLFISSVIAAVGVIGVLLSLFLELANKPEWAGPSFITGIVALLLAVIGAMESKRLWRVRKRGERL